ncbi:50S ribosomal protein L21 [Candidatus Berkelbacteria bacterium CG1_02_42_45]|nr:MAG: 50S ribosomal protein L21 [Candidatus Berkelbacteria bacterium CG1_02_42_45]
MFAIVRIAGKQQIAEVGKKIKIDAKIEAKEKKLKLSEILLLVDQKQTKVGKPLVTGASIEAEVIAENKNDKILVVKHHPKKRYRRVRGHRQDQTILLIKKINEE